MGSATRFARLPGTSQRALLRAALALCWVRLTLRRNRWQEAILEPHPLTKATTSPGRGARPPLPEREASLAGPARSAERVGELGPSPVVDAWAIKAVSGRMPFTATCLVQALALRMLLSRKGYDSNLRLGVAKDGDDRLDAHAWLEVDGQVLIGGEAAGRFVPLS